MARRWRCESCNSCQTGTICDKPKHLLLLREHIRCKLTLSCKPCKLQSGQGEWRGICKSVIRGGRLISKISNLPVPFGCRSGSLYWSLHGLHEGVGFAPDIFLIIEAWGNTKRKSALTFSYFGTISEKLNWIMGTVYCKNRLHSWYWNNAELSQEVHCDGVSGANLQVQNKKVNSSFGNIKSK